MINNLYHYKAVVNRIVDGDTIELTIDLGFTVYWKSTCRLYGINTPELNSKVVEEREKAKLAKQAVESHLPVGAKVMIVSKQLDKYGRPLVDVYCTDELYHLNKWMIDQGHAVEYVP